MKLAALTFLIAVYSLGGAIWIGYCIAKARRADRFSDWPMGVLAAPIWPLLFFALWIARFWEAAFDRQERQAELAKDAEADIAAIDKFLAGT